MDKNKILEAWKALPIKNLLSLVLKGEITIGELEKSVGEKDSKSRDRLDELKKLLQSKEKEMLAQGGFSVDAHIRGLTEYLHKAIHEEWQVGYAPHLRAETLHFRVE